MSKARKEASISELLRRDREALATQLADELAASEVILPMLVARLERKQAEYAHTYHAWEAEGKPESGREWHQVRWEQAALTELSNLILSIRKGELRVYAFKN